MIQRGRLQKECKISETRHGQWLGMRTVKSQQIEVINFPLDAKESTANCGVQERYSTHTHTQVQGFRVNTCGCKLEWLPRELESSLEDNREKAGW